MTILSLPNARIRLAGCLFLWLAWAASSWAQSDYATPYVFTTLAGASSLGNTDGPGDVARFNYPEGVAVDVAGNVYVADTSNCTIRKISRTGVVTTLAGIAGVMGNTDGVGAAARFYFPRGVAVDSAGNVYVADTGNNIIRKISPDGIVTTLAGSAGQAGSADGAGPAARFYFPRGVAVDVAGNLYVADTTNHTIRKITPAGFVTTLAGSAGQAGSIDGTGPAARFFDPSGVAIDTAGNLWVADSSNHTIRRVSSAGVVTTLAGTAGAQGAADGTGSAARFFDPRGVTIDATGNLLVADTSNHAIRLVSLTGVVTTLAGSAGQFGNSDGTGSAARFRSPRSVAIDAAGDLYVADTLSYTIRKITPAEIVTTLAGLAYGTDTGSTDGAGSVARFGNLGDFYGTDPGGVAVGPAGELYVADPENATIRKINSAGVVTTFAGSAGQFGNSDGMGPAARFHGLSGVAVDATGNVYVTECWNHRIRKITPDGNVTTFAGSAGQSGYSDGAGSIARFSYPRAIAVDRTGNVYVADTNNHTIRKITPAGDVTTVPGTTSDVKTITSPLGSLYSYRTYESFDGIVADAAGNLYVTHSQHIVNSHAYDRVQGTDVLEISPDGTVTTIAGSVDKLGSADGADLQTSFSGSRGIAIDSVGNLYVADSLNHVVRQISPAGVVSTVAGFSEALGSADGTGSEARFDYPSGIAVDASDNLYVTSGSTVRKGWSTQFLPRITTQPQSLSVTAGGSVQFSVDATGVPAPTYQWYFNGSPFTGATSRTLSFTGARASDAGDYTVVVANELGSVTSSKATLGVTAAPAPTPTPTPTGGGGGATSPWFALALLVLAVVRRRTSNRRPNFFAIRMAG